MQLFIISPLSFRAENNPDQIKTLPGVFHIPGLAKNLIYVRKMDDAGVKMVFEKETYRMVQGAMVLLKGVQI